MKARVLAALAALLLVPAIAGAHSNATVHSITSVALQRAREADHTRCGTMSIQFTASQPLADSIQSPARCELLIGLPSSNVFDMIETFPNYCALVTLGYAEANADRPPPAMPAACKRVAKFYSRGKPWWSWFAHGENFGRFNPQ